MRLSGQMALYALFGIIKHKGSDDPRKGAGVRLSGLG